MRLFNKGRWSPHSLLGRCVLWAALGASCTALPAAAEGFSLIAQKDVPLAVISKNELRSLYALRVQQFADGTPVTLVVLPDQDPRHRTFATAVLNVFPYVLRENWDKKTFTGAARPPITVDSPEAMVRKVATTPGALGYLPGKEKTHYEGIRYVEVR